MTVLCMDIGGTNFRIGAVNAKGETKLFRKIPVRRVFHTEDVLSDLLGYMESCLDELGEKIDAVSIGFPATLNRERSRVLQAPNIPFVENIPLDMPTRRPSPDPQASLEACAMPAPRT